MQNRGEESISPLSFHSNSSSSSNLSYQKRYQERESGGGGGGEGGYSNNRYYYNKYNKYGDDNGGSSRIIYKTTGANAGNNGNNIRFLKKAYNSKYESQESSVSLISNKNILGDASRVITAADHRNSKKVVDLEQEDDKKSEEKKESSEVKSDDTNNNEKKEQVEANRKNDLKNLPDDITNHLDDMFNDLNLNQLLPEKLPDERESSRFSKWFSVNKDEEKETVPDVQNNNESVASFPQSIESEKYFQPIEKVESNSLFQLLKGPGEMMHQQKSPNSGQVHSVEELEARLRQHKITEEPKDGEQKALQNFFQQHQQQKKFHPQPVIAQSQDDENAFKKFLSQMANEDNKIPAHGQNVLQQMMNKSFPPQHEMMMQQQRKMPVAKMMNPIGSPHIISQQQPQPQGQNIDMMKFLQQQQQKLPIPQVHEVMKRPEVQAIVQGKRYYRVFFSCWCDKFFLQF